VLRLEVVEDLAEGGLGPGGVGVVERAAMGCWRIVFTGRSPGVRGHESCVALILDGGEKIGNRLRLYGD